MRIAIDGRALTGRYTGDRTYWHGLLGALPRADDDMEFIVYTRTTIEDSNSPQHPGLRYVVLPGANDRTWSMLSVPAALHRDKCDLLHVQYTTPPRPLCQCPVITTVHDISFKLFPEWFPRKDRMLLNLSVPVSMRHAAKVITNSDSSRADILREYSLPADHVVAIPLGVPDGFNLKDRPTTTKIAQTLAQYQINRPYILAVGVLQPRKNLKLLCEAYGRARSRCGLEQSLVIAGKIGWKTDQGTLRQAARTGGGDLAADAISFPGYIDDAHLPALYHGADLFAYPSLYEGFGLPPIEAMACGTPTIVSDAPCLPEVVGDSAYIVSARDVEAWSVALETLLTDSDQRRHYSELGPKRAARFSWAETAERTRAVYRGVLRQ